MDEQFKGLQEKLRLKEQARQTLLIKKQLLEAEIDQKRAELLPNLPDNLEDIEKFLTEELNRLEMLLATDVEELERLHGLFDQSRRSSEPNED